MSENFPEPTQPDIPLQASADLGLPPNLHIVMDRTTEQGKTPELSWTGSLKYVADLNSLALTRVCDTPRAGANSPTAVVPEQEVAAWQTLLAVADPRVVEDGTYGGHYPGRDLSRTITEQGEERGPRSEQTSLVRERLPYLKALESVVEGRIEDANRRKRKPVAIPTSEIEAWAILLEPVGEMSEGQPGYDALQRISATIATEAERH